MKQISTKLQSHLNQETTTLCLCWKLLRRDGNILGFTNHDRDLFFDACLFESTSGFNGSEVEEINGLTADNSQLAGALSSAKITQAEILAGKYDGATIEIWLVNWKNPDERLLQNQFELSEISTTGQHFSADLKSLSARLDETRGRMFGSRCDADFGDERCAINTNDPRFSCVGEISDQISDTIFCLTGLNSYEAGWFTNGTLIWQTNSAGEKAIITKHSLDPSGVAKLQLWLSPNRTIEIGEECKLIAGCDKLFATCKGRFENGANFRGFPHIPGNDFATNYAANSSVHDGSPLVD